jgi:hypothetical protein
MAVERLMLVCLLELIFVCGSTVEEFCTKKKIVVSSCATNVYPEKEHVREMRKGNVVEMVAVMEAECENGCPRNDKDIL